MNNLVLYFYQKKDLDCEVILQLFQKDLEII